VAVGRAAPFLKTEETRMESRVALIAVMVEKKDNVGKLNEILHEYGEYIIGRMGLPYPKRGVQIISVAVDAPVNVINTLSGKIGRLEGITSKTVYSGVVSAE
jgi:putative iron-only hydrogenase system regulator